MNKSGCYRQLRIPINLTRETWYIDSNIVTMVQDAACDKTSRQSLCCILYMSSAVCGGERFPLAEVPKHRALRDTETPISIPVDLTWVDIFQVQGVQQAQLASICGVVVIDPCRGAVVDFAKVKEKEPKSWLLPWPRGGFLTPR